MALHIIGIDDGRWWALTASNVVIAALWWPIRTVTGPGTEAASGAGGPADLAAAAPDEAGPERTRDSSPAVIGSDDPRLRSGVGPPGDLFVAALLLLVLALMPPPGIVEGPAPTAVLRNLLTALRAVGVPM